MKQIGPYQIQGELGRGGMGIVYRGIDPVIGRTVAVKTLRPADLGDATEQEKLKERLFREAKSAGILSHPGIVTIYQAGQDDDVLFIAMEFIDGPNLADALARTRPSVELTLQLVRQAAEALDYAHSKGVIHRDIKPANLLLQSEGRVKVADFGIAKFEATNLTKTGTTVGSPAYMSPEQIRAMPMDGRADQYSLGVVAYELLTGLRPYDSDTITSLVFKVVFEQPDLTKLETVPGGARMEPVFRKVLAKEPGERYPNCTAFWEALSGAASGESPKIAEFDSTLPLATSPMVESPKVATSPPAAVPVGVSGTEGKSSKQGLMLGAVGVLAVVLGGGGWWMYWHRTPETSVTEAQTPKPDSGAPTPATKPDIIQKVEPKYTPEALKARIEGTVRIRIGIDEQGKVVEAEVVKPLDPGLDQKALEAVKLWTFKPATVDGKPVPYQVQVEQEFVIPK